MSYLSSYKVVFEVSDVLRLLQFSEGSKNNPPKLINPPQAGHGGWIVDLKPGNSMVEVAIKNSEGSVYVIDYLSCTPERKNEGIEDLINQIGLCVDFIISETEQKVDMIGLCQGGWSSVIYVCLNHEKINSFTGAGVPFNFHASDSALIGARNYNLSTYKALVRMQGGVILGDWMLTNWMMLDPATHMSKWPLVMSHRLFNGWKNADRFEQWYYKDTRNIAGVWYLWCIENIFLENNLFENNIFINGMHADLNNLRKLERVNLIAGGEDDITPMDHVFDLCRYVHANLYLIEGAGHIGVFMGSNGLKDVWKYIFSNQIGNVYEKLSIA